MHGPEWLENPIFPIMLVVAGFFFLYLSLRTKKEHRLHQHSDEHSGIEIQISERRFVDTNRGWILFTLSLGGLALGSHFISEYVFHLYDTTPIDIFTHGLSAMGLTAIVLNFYLTRKRKLYYPISIGAAWVGFIIWEIYEWIQVSISGPGAVFKRNHSIWP